ncbi:MAG: DUF4271 domain-containing protein [Bacteroidales bacterium]
MYQIVNLIQLKLGYFNSRLLQTGNFLIYTRDNNNLATLILLLTLVLFTLLLTTYRNRVSLLLFSLFSSRHFSQLQREGKVSNKNFFFWVHVFSFLVNALLLYLLATRFFASITDQISTYLLYPLALLLVILDFGIKRGLNFYYYSLFDAQDEVPIYALYKLIFSFTNAILLIIIIPISLYSKYPGFFYLYLPLFLINFSVTAYRLFRINSKKINFFNFFIYFCTFEILPYLLMFKWLLNYVNHL